MGYSHGKKWSDRKIEKAIEFVITHLNINYFPSRKEMITVFGTESLTNAVSRHGGSRFWAEKLGLPLKKCETTFGNEYEYIAQKEIFEKIKIESEVTSSRFPYDLITSDGVKIDVKVSKPFINNCNAKANTFNLEKKYPTCDIYLLYCLDDTETVAKTLVIPSCVLIGQTQVGVGKESKWDIYADRWDLILMHNDFFKNFR